MLNLTEPYAPFSTTTFEAFALRGTLKANYIFYYHTKSLLVLRACQDIPHHTQRNQRPNIPGSHPPYPSGRLQYQSSFYKPKTYKDMEEKTLFKLARAITDTGTDTVSSKGGTVTYRITSLKRKLVNGKVVSTSTPSCTLDSASVSWATWGGVTVGNGYLDVKINYSKNTGSSRSTTLTFTQNESNNKINLTVTQEPTPEYWEIRFNPIIVSGIDMSPFFAVTTNINGESGSMADNGTLYKNWIVNQSRHTINVYISSAYQGNFDILSWSCLDKNGNAFSPNYNIPDNQYFTTKTTELGSYTLKKISSPSVDNGTLILPSRFNPTKKYPLDLNFYWGTPI